MKIVDMHCDTISRLLALEDQGKTASLLENDGHLDLKKMQKGDYLLQNFAMFVPTTKVDDPLHSVLRMIDKYYRELERNKDIIAPVFTFDDIAKNSAGFKMSALLTLEDGAVVKNDLSILRDLYRLGVRMIALTWNYPNGIGFPNIDNDKKLDRYQMIRQINDRDGLTPFGIEYVKECERLGIIIDVSHLSDKGFYDVLRYTKKPFVASHSNARKVCDVARNLDDDMIKKLSERGGVMGINFCEDFISADADGSIKNILAHIRHIIEVGGEDCLGLGSDFDGIGDRKELADASLMGELIKAMQQVGYSAERIDKITHRNVLRLYREVLKN